MFFLSVWVLTGRLYSQDAYLYDQLVEIGFPGTERTFIFVSEPEIYTQDWDELEQVDFWREIMNTPPELSLINAEEKRLVLAIVPTADIEKLTSKELVQYKDSLRTLFRIDSTDRILVTHGRAHYYQFDKVLFIIEPALHIFLKEKVDPWYAQAILLIESPGISRTSPKGAKGPFQLMPSVARQYGLKVTKSRDDRDHLDSSAYAAARLIREICIPQAEAIMTEYQIPYTRHSLWFKLLVMHIYHAGAGNVRRVFLQLQPKSGGKQLIMKLWDTSVHRFKSSSQNYSQLTLAALLELEDLIHRMGGFYSNPSLESPKRSSY